jgi:cobalt-zinc-cadmium efflux system outer membrane protein
MLKLKGILLILLIQLTSVVLFSQTSITLKEAISRAKENNPILKTESFNVGIAQADITTAKLRPNPILNNQTLQLMNPSFFPANTGYLNGHNMQIWWQLTKPMQMPALRKFKLEVAQQGVKLAQTNYAEIERNLFLNVSNNWINAWYAKVNLDLISYAKTNIDSLVYINELRLKKQVITTTDLIRTQLIAEQYKLQIRTAQQEYRNQLQNLRFLLGTTDSININLNDEFISASVSNKIDSLLNYAEINRTDIQVAQTTINTAKSNISLQKALAKPTPEIGMIYNPQNKIPYLGVYGTIQIPIFSRNQGEIQKSKLLQAQAEQSLQTTQQQLKAEITTSFNSYQTQKQNLEKFKVIMKQAEQILSSVKYAYLKGGTTIIDFLEAQRTWFDSQKMYYDELYNYSNSYVQLLYSSGLINQLK